MRMLRLLILIPAFSAVAADVISVGAFRSVALSNGGHVIVRHGAVQRVSILKGNRRCTQIRLAEGQRLVIDNHGSRRECPRHERIQIEVVTPNLSAVSVSHGGTLQTLGAFPAQASIDAAVEQGGRIDIRSIAADSVNASVYSGGGIFTTSRKTLSATVQSGGAITYWGDVKDVKELVRDGGVVQRGEAEDAQKPLSEFGGGLPEIPPLPPLPPLPAIPPNHGA